MYLKIPMSLFTHPHFLPPTPPMFPQICSPLNFMPLFCLLCQLTESNSCWPQVQGCGQPLEYGKSASGHILTKEWLFLLLLLCTLVAPQYRIGPGEYLPSIRIWASGFFKGNKETVRSWVWYLSRVQKIAFYICLITWDIRKSFNSIHKINTHLLCDTVNRTCGFYHIFSNKSLFRLGQHIKIYREYGSQPYTPSGVLFWI